MKHPIRLLMIGLAIMLVAACSSQDKKDNATKEPIYKVLSQASLKAGDAIPVPEGDPVLTVTGMIKNTNQGDTIVMDIPTLESVGQVEYTVHDPFEDQTITYQGVLLSDLLALWGIDPAATTMSVTALNDYQVDIALKDVRDYPVIFALRREGEYMEVATRGPAMLVFPYNHFKFEQTVYNDYWVWQIKSIDIH